MNAWVTMIPVALGAAAVLTLPGMAVGWAAGLRREVLVVHAPMLTATVLTTGAWVGSRTPMAWGLWMLAAVTVVVVAVIRVTVRLLRIPHTATSGPLAPLPGRPALHLLGLTGLVVAIMASVVGAGIGSPLHAMQVWDFGYHVNAILHVDLTGDPGPESVGSHRLWDQPFRGFYPPVLADLGVLLLRAGAPDPVAAANLVLWVLAAVAWPLGVASLLRVATRTSRSAWAVGLLAATTTAPLPYLVGATAGYLPNAMGVLLVPGTVAAAAALGILLHGGPRANRAEVLRASGLVLLGAGGVVLVHPGAFFLLAAILLPLAVGAVALVCRWAWCGGRRAWAVGVAGALLLVGGGAVLIVLELPQMASLRIHEVRAFRSLPGAVADVLLLAPGGKLAYGPAGSFPSWGAGALVLVGLGSRLVRPSPTTWVALSYLLVSGLYVVAAAVDNDLSLLATSFWHNESARIGPGLGVLQPLRVAWGVQCLSGLARAHGAAVLPGSTGRRSPTAPWASAVVCALAVGALLPVSSWTAGMRMLRVPHDGNRANTLTTPREEAIYRRIPRGDPRDSVIGMPWSGGHLAGPLSGHRSVFGHVGTSKDAPRALLRERFSSYQADPAVCREVLRLRIRYAVEDSSYLESYREARFRQLYRGVVGLEGTPGLTRILGDDRTAVYEVAPCPVRGGS